jgi:hypothetical protein
VLVDGDVVRLPDEWLGERDGQRAVAQIKALAPRLEMYRDVGVRQRVAHCGLDGIGGAVALDDGLPRGHAHDGIGEVVPAGLAQPQPTQLDVVAEALDGGRGARLGIGGCGVHQDARVLVDQPPRGREHEARDHERGDRVALLKAAGDGDHSAEHGDRAGHVAREVQRVGAQRGRLVPAGRPHRDDDARDVDEQRDADDREDVPASLEPVATLGELTDGLAE